MQRRSKVKMATGFFRKFQNWELLLRNRLRNAWNRHFFRENATFGQFLSKNIRRVSKKFRQIKTKVSVFRQINKKQQTTKKFKNRNVKDEKRKETNTVSTTLERTKAKELFPGLFVLHLQSGRKVVSWKDLCGMDPSDFVVHCVLLLPFYVLVQHVYHLWYAVYWRFEAKVRFEFHHFEG